MKDRCRKPPAVAEYILKFMAPDNFYTSAPGDFEEIFREICTNDGYPNAARWYWIQVLISIPAFFRDSFYWSIAMFSNYFKTVFRNIMKQKGFSFINITGLSVGFASFMLILLFVRYELSYDSFNVNAPNIYRIGQGDRPGQGLGGDIYSGTPSPLAPAIAGDYSEIVDYVRLDKATYKVKEKLTHNNNVYYEERFFMADPSIFNVFSYNIIAGNSQTPLQDLSEVVISESIAEKYFGSNNPIGQVINFAGKADFTVAAIMEDIPHNSHIKIDFLVSWENLERLLGSTYVTSWSTSNFFTYLLLEDGADPDLVLEKVIANSATYPQRSPEFFQNLILMPIEKIHLVYDRSNLEPVFEMKYIYVLTAVAVIVLIIACINFMNLSSARSASRAKEISMRKVVGAQKKQIILQFLSESVIMSMIALVIGVIIASIFLPYLTEQSDISLIDELTKPASIVILLLTALIVGLLSGTYPAFVISAYKPASVLKGELKTGKKGIAFRNALVVLQFAVSVALIISSLFISKQLNFMQNTKLGWNKDQVLSIQMYDREIRNQYEAIKSEMLNHPAITHATVSRFQPSRTSWRHGVWWEGKQEGEGLSVWVMMADHDFIKTMHMEIANGRDFDKNIPTDMNGPYILNEAAVRAIGWEDPIGKKFTAFGDDAVAPVIGVVKDFHFRSLHHPIEPLLIVVAPRGFENLQLRIRPDNMRETMSFIAGIWDNFAPGIPMDYYFLDDDYNSMYTFESQIGRVISIFTVLSIFIACLGLFGLAAFIAEQRTKEIGIRKVLGASVSSVIITLLKSFVKWVIIANLFAWPAAYFLMDLWLGNFAYKTEIGISIFVWSAATAFAIAVVTVGYQTIRAAMTNPADTLRFQ